MRVEVESEIQMAVRLGPRDFEVWEAEVRGRMKAIRVARRIMANPIGWVSEQATVARWRKERAIDREIEARRDRGGDAQG